LLGTKGASLRTRLDPIDAGERGERGFSLIFKKKEVARRLNYLCISGGTTLRENEKDYLGSKIWGGKRICAVGRKNGVILSARARGKSLGRKNKGEGNCLFKNLRRAWKRGKSPVRLELDWEENRLIFRRPSQSNPAEALR